MFDRLFITLQVLRGDLAARLEDQEGAAMVEYGLLVVGIAVVVGIAAAALGGRIAVLFDGIVP
jgi:Flp pilus assembly pilin Flp